MSCRTLGAGNFGLAGVTVEHFADREGFDFIVQKCRRAVGVNVADLFRTYTRVL